VQSQMDPTAERNGSCSGRRDGNVLGQWWTPHLLPVHELAQRGRGRQHRMPRGCDGLNGGERVWTRRVVHERRGEHVACHLVHQSRRGGGTVDLRRPPRPTQPSVLRWMGAVRAITVLAQGATTCRCDRGPLWRFSTSQRHLHMCIPGTRACRARCTPAARVAAGGSAGLCGGAGGAGVRWEACTAMEATVLRSGEGMSVSRPYSALHHPKQRLTVRVLCSLSIVGAV
jgi:hypothetical protein